MRTERAPCSFLIDCGELLRCGYPEDDEIHDPSHPHGHHAYDPTPFANPEHLGRKGPTPHEEGGGNHTDLSVVIRYDEALRAVIEGLYLTPEPEHSGSSAQEPTS